MSLAVFRNNTSEDTLEDSPRCNARAVTPTDRQYRTLEFGDLPVTIRRAIVQWYSVTFPHRTPIQIVLEDVPEHQYTPESTPARPARFNAGDLFD